jgi:hypothetical protein
MLHRVRDLLMRQRTQLINALRRIWPSSALRPHRGVKGSKSCWRLSHRMRVRACRLTPTPA